MRVIGEVVALDEYREGDNEGGYINLARAENRLAYPLLADRFKRVMQVPEFTTQYDDMKGNREFRAQVAFMLQSQLFRRDRPVSPDHVIVANGVSPLIEEMSLALCDEGDGVILPSPYYQGFVTDCTIRARCTLLFAHTTSATNFRFTVDDLEKAYQQGLKKGVRVRLLIFCSPNNPLGVVYSHDFVEQVLAWADSKPDLHVVSDEVYGLSVHDPHTEFHSVARVRPVLGDRIHVLHGFSKDFVASGFRVGTLYSENEELLCALAGTAIFSSASGITEYLLKSVIEDHAFLTNFVHTNRRQLREAYDICHAALTALDVPFFPAQAGFFVFMSLRKLMAAPTEEEEDRVWRLVFYGAKVNLSPGRACGCVEPGWFRFCFSSGSLRALRTALDRLAKCLAANPPAAGKEPSSVN